MPFERSLEIERRLDDVLRLISTGRFSTPMLAEKVGVSIPTISRIVAALRNRGHDIEAERTSKGWRYVLISSRRFKPEKSSFPERIGASR
jgi:predicted DNA-binding transcriptional regulator YafY